MILTKIRGRMTACAWLTAWAIASSHRVRSGRISDADGVDGRGRSAATPSICRAPGSAGLGRGGAPAPRAHVAIAEADRPEVVGPADPAATGHRVGDHGAVPGVGPAGLDDITQRVEVTTRAELGQQIAGDEPDQRLALDAGPAGRCEVHELEPEVEVSAVSVPDGGGERERFLDRVEGGVPPPTPRSFGQPSSS